MRGTLRAVTAATAALALSTSGLTSCGEEEKKPVTLPSLTPNTASPTSTAGMTDEERIRTIYTDYATNWIDAQHLPPPERRQFLARFPLIRNDLRRLTYSPTTMPSSSSFGASRSHTFSSWRSTAISPR